MTDRLATYKPRDLDAARWAVIEWFVREVMAQAARLDRQNPIADIYVVSKFVDWAHNRHGYALDARTLFTGQRIVSYTKTGGESGISQFTMQNRRSTLLRVAEVVNPKSVVRLPPIERKGSVHPYTDAELAAIRSAVLGKRSLGSRMSGLLLVALGAGAGLGTGDVRELRIRDIEVRDDGVVVHVPDCGPVDYPRSVAAFPDWESDIRIVVLDADPDAWAVCPNARTRDSRLVSNFTSGLTRTGLTMQRLRATWLVRHLNLGTPPLILRDAYGASSLEAVSRYLDYAHLPDEDTRMRFLRGQGWVR